MDFTQKKLSKNEWNYIEIPVEAKEINVLQLIVDGYTNTDIRVNLNHSLQSFTKIQKTPDNDIYLFQQFFEPIISTNNKGLKKTKSKPKQADIIRVETLKANILKNRNEIFEFVLLDLTNGTAKKMPNGIFDSTTENLALPSYSNNKNLYTLLQLKKNSVYPTINPYVAEFIERYIAEKQQNDHKQITNTLYSAVDIIENNPMLMKYEDFQLYPHQRQIFDLFRNKPEPKLVLYMAPTGTGKTLTPIGLSQQYKVIFVCVARHIGLSLGKSAVSVGKRIAFAFGCETASDIRLHNLAATSFIKHNRSGGIFRVDNSRGEKVDMMICDVQSYLTAMHYMLSFNAESTIITYWDEPTITMDYDSHELHPLIHRNWTENKISKLVLSSATLPRMSEIEATTLSFETKFTGATVHCIDTFDCKKSISLLDPTGKCVLPHLACSNYRDVLKCVEHCKVNKTLLRYFDLGEILRFIRIATESVGESKFTTIDAITMTSIKLYYLDLLEQVNPDTWPDIHNRCIMEQTVKFNLSEAKISVVESKFAQAKLFGENLRKINSVIVEPTQQRVNSSVIKKSNSMDTPITINKPIGSNNVLFTTEDANVLTDGPSIYMTNEVMKIATFYIQQSKIPDVILAGILHKITTNNRVMKEIEVLEKTIEDELGKDMEKEKKMERDNFSGNIKRLKEKLEQLNSQIQPVQINEVFIPNTKQHQEKWHDYFVDNAFIPIVDETVIIRIMTTDVEDKFKLLLLLGIGVFDYSYSSQYLDIIKELADKQHLFMIIASSDYIFGTNYPFCHAIIGKDLGPTEQNSGMSFHKLLQAFGRVGRQNSQQHYDIRLRHGSNVQTILQDQPSKEVANFRTLFN